MSFSNIRRLPVFSTNPYFFPSLLLEPKPHVEIFSLKICLLLFLSLAYSPLRKLKISWKMDKADDKADLIFGFSLINLIIKFVKISEYPIFFPSFFRYFLQLLMNS